MTLANMRAQGVRSIEACCHATGCRHDTILDADGLPDDLPVPDVGLHLRCSRCGGRIIQTRPHWVEMKVAGMGRET